MTIDPGARLNGGTGIARFEHCYYKNFNGFVFEASKLYKDHCNFETYEERVSAICSQLVVGFGLTPCDTTTLQPLSENVIVFIERPKFFDDNKGLTAAKSNSLFKLIYLYGRLTQLFMSLGYTVVPLEINHWKGHLSKAQTKQRLKRIHTLSSNVSGDEIDAIAMGYYILGKFNG